jgi:thiamine pyrophosphokinase
LTYTDDSRLTGANGDRLIGADGGRLTDAARRCDAVLGDFDSVKTPPDGAELIRFAREKNQTDGELGILYLAEKGFRRVDIYGAFGGRADHVCGNLTLPVIALNHGVSAVIRGGGTTVYALGRGLPETAAANGEIIPSVNARALKATDIKHSAAKNTSTFPAPSVLRARCAKGAAVSILPFTDSVQCKNSRGLYYPTDGLTLRRDTTRGISNLAVADEIEITLSRGTALVFVTDKG